MMIVKMMKNSIIKQSLPYFLALVAVIFWGFNFVAVTVAVEHITPLFTLFLRFAIVSAILLPLFPKPPIPIKQVIIISITFGLFHLGCMFWSLKLGLDSSVGIVVDQIGVPFSILLAFIFFRENPRILEIIGIILAIIGTFVLVETPNSLSHPFAFILMILAGLFWAVYSIQLKKFNSPSPLGLVAWISLFSAGITLTLSLLFEENQISSISSSQTHNWIALLYTSIGGSIIAHGIWGHLMTTQSINRIVPMILLVPIFGVFGGVMFLHEPLSTEMIIGSILMVAGVGITLLKKI